MKCATALTVENFIDNWNSDISTFPLTTADLKNSHVVMEAVLHVFHRLGINLDTVLAPPTEESKNENTIYYWDLCPIINTTRVIKHLVSEIPQAYFISSILRLLQPMVATAHSMLLLLLNLMLFYEVRLKEITPYEEELLSKTEQVMTLESYKNHLLELLNEQAEEKGKRAQRLEMNDQNIKQLEEELKQEKEAHDEDKPEWKAILKESQETKIILEQKKSQRDALLSEIEKKNALRVHDIDDIKAQAEIAAQNVQEAEEKLNTLHNTLIKKESSLKNLQTIQPNLATTNNLLYEIIKISTTNRDYEDGDVDSDSIQIDLDVLNSEVLDQEAWLSDLRADRTEVATNVETNMAVRHQEERDILSKIREAEEKDTKDQESSIKVVQKVEELKESIIKCQREKPDRLEELDQIKIDFVNNLKQMQDMLLMKTQESKKRIENALQNRG